MVCKILMFGFIEQSKNYFPVIDALGDNTHYSLVISGKTNTSSSQFEQLLKRAIARYSNITLTNGFADKQTVLSGADIVLCPYDYAFGFSGVIADSISFGKPFLVSDLPIYRDLLRLYSYKIALPVTSRSILNALEAVVADYDGAKSQLKRLAQLLSWKNVAFETIRVYKEA